MVEKHNQHPTGHPHPDRSRCTNLRTPARRSEGEWRKLLSEEVYRIARCGGTEPPFTGRYWNHEQPGIYACACCGTDLFDSRDKFDSGTGWPSFKEALHAEHVVCKQGCRGREIVCGVCDAHLGHLFADGPPPSGKRYCVNSASLLHKPFCVRVD